MITTRQVFIRRPEYTNVGPRAKIKRDKTQDVDVGDAAMTRKLKNETNIPKRTTKHNS